MMDLYQKYYAVLQFERSGLFGLIRDVYHCNQVLYPGSFVHITPSLYFPHVVYVDRHPEAQRFFADVESVARFVERNKHYRQSAYLRFIDQDFTTPLPLLDETFDLLISIFADGVIAACKRYIRPGGLALSNRRLEAKEGDFELLSVIRFQGGKYRLIEGEQALQIAKKSRKQSNSNDLRQGERGLEYAENQTYCLLSKRWLKGP